MGKSSQALATAVLAVVVLFGSFAAASNDFAFGSQSLLAATIGIFQSKPLITISRNTNSPTGSILSGRSQVLAVFDVKGEGLKNLGHIVSIPVVVTTYGSGTDLAVGNFSLNYTYCVPKGNVYAYGYKYGYSGVYCSAISFSPSSVTKNAGYRLDFSGIDLPVFSDQTSASISVIGTPRYAGEKRSAKVQARVTNGVVAQSDVCRTVHYGFKKRDYGYSKCTSTTLSTNVWLAYGNILSIIRSYGYGYPTIVTPGKPTNPNQPPIIEPPTIVPPQMGPTGGNTTQGGATTGTQTGGTGTQTGAGTDSGTTDTPPPKPKPLPVKTNPLRENIQFETQTP